MNKKKFIHQLGVWIATFIDLFVAIIAILTLTFCYLNWGLKFRFWWLRTFEVEKNL